MNLLDDLAKIKKIDTAGVLESIDSFTDQCLQALAETQKLNLLNIAGKIDNIVVAGMGGSAFTPEIVKTLFSQEILVPYEIIREYHLPGFVNKRTLVIISSYSGTTKEAISCCLEALGKGSLVYAICCANQQSELYQLVKVKGIDSYIFKEKFNPCRQPRLGGGYLICGHIGLLLRSGLIDSNFDNIKKAVISSAEKNQFNIGISFLENPAKQLAKKISGKFPILIASEFLQGAIHGFANQLNETAKTNSAFHFIPEFNHHRLDGLEFPQEFKETGIFVFYPSDLYDKRNLIRYQITQEVVKKNGYKYCEYKPTGKDKIVQIFETIIFNSYVSFYLAILHNKNPLKIPWVDYFKAEMAKRGY